MTLLFMDGFDAYRETADLLASGRWAAVAGALGPDYSRSQGNGFRMSGAGIITRNWTSVPEAWVGFAARFTTAGVAATILVFRDSVGNEQCRLQRNAGGNLVLQRSGTVLATSAGTYTTGVWRYIEVRAFVDNAVGTMEVWVDGVSVLSAGPVDTSSSGTPEIAQVAFVANHDVDDVYVVSTTGAAPLNARLGDSRVAPIQPAGPGVSADWSPNGLTNHRGVAQNDDGDHTLNQSGTVGATDLFDYQDPPIDAGSILATQLVTTARRGTSGTHNLASVARSGGTNYENTQVALGTTMSTQVDVMVVNPDTGLAWTVADLKAVEFGYRLKT